MLTTPEGAFTLMVSEERKFRGLVKFVQVHTGSELSSQDLIPGLPVSEVQHSSATSPHWLPVLTLCLSAALVRAGQRS